MGKKVKNKAKEQYSATINKMQKIFDIYKKSEARLWILDTDIYNMWDRFAQNLKPILSENNLNKLPNKISISQTKDNKSRNRYSLLLNNNNITPTSRNKYVAKTTMQQYLEVGSALSYINYSKEDKISDNTSYSLNPNVWDLCLDTSKELNNAFLRSLANSLTSKDPFVVSLGYSLFVNLIYKTDKKIFFDIKDHTISTKKPGNDSISEYANYEISTIPAMEIIRHLVGEKEGPKKEIKGSSSTYKNASNNLLAEYDLSKIVDYMYETVSSGKDISEIDINSTTLDDQFSNYIKQCENKIEKARSHLRKNMISARVKDENLPYSDLENSKPNEDHVDRLIVCHIYDVKEIKKAFTSVCTRSKEDIPLDHFINMASDHNNGIFLNASAHALFDNQTIWFDNEGKLCYKQSLRRTVENAFGDDLENVRIKPSVLTPEMVEYFNKKRSNS